MEITALLGWAGDADDVMMYRGEGQGMILGMMVGCDFSVLSPLPALFLGRGYAAVVSWADCSSMMPSVPLQAQTGRLVVLAGVLRGWEIGPLDMGNKQKARRFAAPTKRTWWSLKTQDIY